MGFNSIGMGGGYLTTAAGFGVSARIFAAVVFSFAVSLTASAQPARSPAAGKSGGNVDAQAFVSRVASTDDLRNRQSLTLLAGSSGSTALQMAQDASIVLGGADDVRVLPIVGKGGPQNISDLLYLKGIDLAITQSDVLAALSRGELGGDIKSEQIAYIAKLCNEELHVVARGDIGDLGELTGRAVNFGEQGSGTQFSARRVFAALGIEVREVNLSHADAMERLQRGEISAHVFLGGKPTPDALAMERIEGLRLLPIAYPPSLEADYLPAKLTHADYPDLIGEGQSIDTVAVGAVLTVVNWPAKHERYQLSARFVEDLFGNLKGLREPARHAKWHEMNLPAPVPGIVQFRPAKAWLEREVTGARSKASATQSSSRQSELTSRSSGGEAEKRLR
ncbi:TAXI family TRAP transporter solute-binding subunit [Filomicrobium sp.]|uniref:TAXI family TRAP transporter solute-binding subunit n=1 Tax=Filomicrobium sp. TaxID=2024831 RepID=UPI00258FE343|nr:TAXI family TRAP transporter solute-binding subunit [Filomicrobium sp.]MCV0369249.1 C4-dicarboxylate ABC transporter substrate-binding protein [Filomicrobium sp.]